MLNVQASANIPNGIEGRMLDVTLIKDEKGNQVSCSENNFRQRALVTALVNGRALREIPNE